MKRFFAGAVVLGMSLCGMSLMAQQQTVPSTQDQDQAGSTQQQPTYSQSARSLQGTIVKSGDKYVLRESATDEAYQLDDQDKAKQFEGKEVKVTGNVDPTLNMVKVVDISAGQ